MSSKGVGIAFKLTALVLLLGILGISIGNLIINLNIRDDVEATPDVPAYPTTFPPPSTDAPPAPTTTKSAPPPPCTSAPPVPPKTTTAAPVDPVDPVDQSKTTTAEPQHPEEPKTTRKAPPETTTKSQPETTTKAPEEPVDPSNPDSKNIAHGVIIGENDKRYGKFAEISNLYEKWMDVKVDPCDDFYHYVCGKGQKNKEQSPFLISEIKDNKVADAMWKVPDTYWASAPLPVQQAKWIKDKCATDKSFTLADQQAKLREMMAQYIGYNGVNVPFLYPNDTTTMTKTQLSELIGYAKGQYGAYPLLTSFVAVDFKDPDDSPYTYYIDQPQPFFIDSVYTDDAYPTQKAGLVSDVTDNFHEIADILNVDLDTETIIKMAEDVVDFDRVLSQMQQDPIVRRQVTLNYNPYTLADLNTKADQFDWVPFLQSAMTMLGSNPLAQADGNWKVIIMEKDITLNKLNALINQTDPVVVANYVYFTTLSQILDLVPAPLAAKARAPMKYRAVLKRDKHTLTGMLRKPETKAKNDGKRTASSCASTVEKLLPWAATRMYVDTDIPDKEARKTLKENVAEIANWIFFGFRSQLDQLNWLDEKSKQAAFDKLNNIQLNVAYPDWVTEDAKLTEFYKGIGAAGGANEVTADDNYMMQRIKIMNYNLLQEVSQIVDEPTRDRGDFSEFIGTTNAWYQPQMNSITFPEGILQEPFYNPEYPLAAIFGGLGSISGHELTHGFDDHGVQWNGIGALDDWMSADSKKDFNAMAQCVIDEYSSFCPYTRVCVNGANTQGENIADNGGIQAAYKALKAYESLKGADPKLPGFGSAFTSDQLFFLTFGQTWCDQDQGLLDYKYQIATDVHSPALYRVLGTLQNFPAFRNAFNCPVGKKYTPEKHCDVWTSMPFK